MKWELILETNEILAINKPAGLLSIPDRQGKDISLKKILSEKFGEVFTIHRLDRETSGVIIFARHAEAHKFFSRQFEERNTMKIYYGLVIGSPQHRSGTVDSAIAEHPVKKGTMVVHRNGKEAITDYEVTETFRGYSWMKFRIHTGRTHQIRVHAKHIGHPIACDPIYGDGSSIKLSAIKHRYKLSKHELDEKPILDRLALHSASLTLNDISGNQLALQAPLPRDLSALLNQLRKNIK